MTKDDIQLLYEYDRWANKRVMRAASTLSAEEFTRDLGGSFRSVRDTVVHIVGGESGWLTCWKEPSPSSTFMIDSWTRRDARFSPNAFPNLAAVQLKWAEVEREQVEFVNGVTNESLGRMLPVGTTQISLAHVMQHLANHSTYHRGQVALMMRQLAAEPLAGLRHVFDGGLPRESRCTVVCSNLIEPKKLAVSLQMPVPVTCFRLPKPKR